MRWRRRAHNQHRAIDSWRAFLIASAFSICSLLAIGWAPASAHAQIDVGDGQYSLEIGFRDEPTYVGQPNAVFVKVGKYASGGAQPVDDLASTLKVEVMKDGQTLSPDLVPQGDGEYEAPFVPTATGDYTFRVLGTIEGAAVDESVTSGPQTFSTVQPLTAIELPAAAPDAAAVAAQSAQADAAMARMLAIAGIVIGLLGLLAGALALARSGRPAPAASASPEASGEPAGKLIR